MRQILSSDKIHLEALHAIENFNKSVILDVDSAIRNNDWVVVGMAQNPIVKNAKKFLSDKNINFNYLEYGSYFSAWKLRLAIKLWSGWPTYPQVFHKGMLIGGFDELKKYHVTLN